MNISRLQKSELSGKKFKVQAFKIYGDCKDYAENVLRSFSAYSPENAYPVTVKLNDTRRTRYIEGLSRLTDEKYFLHIECEGAILEAATERGVFRALCTLILLNENGELADGKIEDYPLFSVRGYIEGFYGKTWEQNSRLGVMRLMALHGMNTFYYAPKDDLYHREKWSELYPEKELSDLKSLKKTADGNQMDFYYCIAPGLNFKYTAEADYSKLLNKTTQLYNIGVRCFGLLLDDIPAAFQYSEDAAKYPDTVHAHIELINRLYSDLKAKDYSVRLTVCPTLYHGLGNEYEISVLGQSIPSEVEIFWTGAEICSRILTVREADEFERSVWHKPLFWDNFPVNDCEMMNEMHLGAIEGRDTELYRHSAGLISNVMEYAECSKIPLLTVADYLWNPVTYNKEASLREAEKTVLGEKAGLFRLFSDHLGVSCLSRYSSAYMSEVFANANFCLLGGEKEKALDILKDYTARMKECFVMLSDKSVPLFAELERWVKKFGDCCEILESIIAVISSPGKVEKITLKEKLDRYTADSAALTGFCLYEAATKALKM